MTFDRYPDGCGPDDCEPGTYQEPDDPDRHYEWAVENGAEIEQERVRAADRKHLLPWEATDD